MPGRHGFDELSEELARLARKFEQAAERKKSASDDMVRARGPAGQFISFREAIVRGISQALRDSAIPQASTEAKNYLPTGGERGRSGRPQIDQEALGWQGDRYQHLFYSRNDLVAYHEFGTGQHSAQGTTEARGSAGPGYIIEPTDEDVLSFYWDKAGYTVAFEYVVHPGVEGKHFMQRALRDSTRSMQRNIADQIDNMDWSDL